MTIVVEDGTGPTNANSYVSVAELQSFAHDRSVTLPGSAEQCEPLLIQAMDWIEAQEANFIGVREFASQALSWPRIECYESLGVPIGVKKAQMFAALDVHAGVSLLPTVTTASKVTSEKIGDIAVSYKVADNSTPRLVAASSYLNQYLVNAFGQFRVNRG